MTLPARRFLAELKRRRVYHAAVVYAVVAFGVWQVADIAVPSLGLPPSAVTFVLVVTALGFPLVVVLAWAYELRPEDAAPESGPPAASPPPQAGSEAADSAAARATLPARARSIAVLPFDDMSAEGDSEYFADGIVEELTNALARIQDLRVAARTSAFGFRASKRDVREIGRALGVSYLVEGSVRRAGNRLRIAAQLIDTDGGHHVWSERYERPVGDVFAIQDEIVGAVTASLLSRLPAATEARVASRTGDATAYDTYLRARSAYLQLSPESLERATGLYEEAIARDPGFALAHAGLAETLIFLAIGFGIESPREIMPRARAAAERALALAPDLPEAHLVRGLELLYHAWDYPAARRELERALELSPSFFEAHLWLEMYHTYVEADYETALRLERRAQQLSPFDPGPRLRIGTIHYIYGRFAEAEAIFRATVEEGTNPLLAWLGMADTLVRSGRVEEAAGWARKLLSIAPAPSAALGVGGVVLGVAGHTSECRAALAELERRGERGTAAHFWIAAVLASLNRMDEAFQHLGRAVEERDPNLLYLSVAPPPLGLHNDPRFTAILERIGLAHLANRPGDVRATSESAPT